MKVIFCGGGTAGHISPAIAMAEIIKDKYKDASFLFIGRACGDENRAITASGYRLRELKLRGLRRSLSPKNVLALLEALKATEKAAEIIEEFSPDLIIGTGGYVTWPVIRAGIRLKIPVAIHESNASPGLVTKLLARGCDAVMLGMKSAEKELPREAKAYYVGNPVRRGFKRIDKHLARRKLGISNEEFLIVSFGGSLGAQRLNDVVTTHMKKCISSGKPIRHLHATGKRNYDEIRSAMPELAEGKRYKIVPYIENVPLWFSAADLAITRAGAITLAEITECNIPSIIIPSPNVSGDHQKKNAEGMCKAGAAVMIEEEDLSQLTLEAKINEILTSKTTREKMKNALSELGKCDTRERILDVIESIRLKNR